MFKVVAVFFSTNKQRGIIVLKTLLVNKFTVVPGKFIAALA
jgi:hypothetical protein